MSHRRRPPGATLRARHVLSGRSLTFLPRLCYNAGMKLMREVRCFPGGSDPQGASRNTWAGSTCGDELGTFWIVRAVVEGAVDRITGYVCDIKRLDALIRESVVPRLRDAAGVPFAGARQLSGALGKAFSVASEAYACPGLLQSLELRVSPLTWFEVSRGSRGMVAVTRCFEFAAAHRLHRAELSDEENLRMFGKCSNPHGHGHNYLLEVTVSPGVAESTGMADEPIELPQLDRVVAERVLADVDHKNLNTECVDFAALIPTVENIARVIWNRLENAVRPCRLTRIRVWETPKTYAEYLGE